MRIEEARRVTPSPALDAAAEETRRAVRELRDLAAGIHPAVLTDHGLAAALEDLAADAALPVELELDEARHPPDIEAAGYFLVAEALANVAKHAQATRGRGGRRAPRRRARDHGRRRWPRGSGPAARQRAARAGGPRRRARRHARARQPGRRRHDVAGRAPAMRPCSTVSTASTRRWSDRSWPSSSFSKMLVTCFSTAGGPTCMRSAMPRLERPSTISASTSRSRGVSRSSGFARRWRPSIRATTSGSSAVPPAATLRTAARKSSRSAIRCLSR